MRRSPHHFPPYCVRCRLASHIRAGPAHPAVELNAQQVEETVKQAVKEGVKEAVIDAVTQMKNGQGRCDTRPSPLPLGDRPARHTTRPRMA
jgi:hypothetical protein